MRFVISLEPAGFELIGCARTPELSALLAVEARKADCIAPERVTVIDGDDLDKLAALPRCYGLGGDPEAGLELVRAFHRIAKAGR